MVDDLTAAGVPCFGPTARAAQLEASKSFSKSFMERHGIPTARWKSFTDPQEACCFIRGSVRGEGWVIRQTLVGLLREEEFSSRKAVMALFLKSRFSRARNCLFSPALYLRVRCDDSLATTGSTNCLVIYLRGKKTRAVFRGQL